MKILSAPQIRQADAYTIAHEPVASLDLMERAAVRCVQWIEKHMNSKCAFRIFCGPGNNGGDGLAIARMLFLSGYDVSVYVVGPDGKHSTDFLENEKRFVQIAPERIHGLESPDDFPEIDSNDYIVDALFGTGLSKAPLGLFALLIDYLNNSGAKIIAIDIPSGLFADQHSYGASIIKARFTLSFQVPKLAFLFAENEKFVGSFHLLDIGLDRQFIEGLESSAVYLNREFIASLLKPRKKFSHKGSYGHSLLMAGGQGKLGAAVLAAGACLRTGTGLLSVHVPEEGVEIMQVAWPEAMIDRQPDLAKYNAIGIGPGIGTGREAKEMLRTVLLDAKAPLVLDADALNILSTDSLLLESIPAGSILTPHPKEFERLTGKSDDDFARHEKQLAFSAKHKTYVVLKGAHTCITTPDGISYFNSTGNPGMAKGGSGDALTGMITSLLAQGYASRDAALVGVYLHGLAGDLAAHEKGMDGMIAHDVVEAIPAAWKSVRQPSNI